MFRLLASAVVLIALVIVAIVFTPTTSAPTAATSSNPLPTSAPDDGALKGLKIE